MAQSKLTPVDHNPFEGFTPVDHDPFQEHAPDIKDVAKPILEPYKPGWLASWFANPDDPTLRVPDDKSYPNQLDAHFAKQFDQTYGSDVAPYLQPGSKTKKMSIDQAIHADSDFTGRAFGMATATSTTPTERDTILKNWIAAQKSPLSALGFDPGHTVYTPPNDAKLTLAGMYRPDNDTMWYDGNTQDSEAHESMHRGIEQLRKADMLPASAKDIIDNHFDGNGEEYLVRALKIRHFGDIEAGHGSAGDAQIKSAHYWMDESSPIKEKFNKALDDLEDSSQKLLAKKHPKGPR